MGYTEAFEEILGYKFNDIKLLEQALSHSSYANEKKLASGSNERLEFLGDSVLSIVVSDYIYKNLNVPEGELTKLRASLVCEKSLYVFAKQIHLGDFLFLGKGEENTGGRERPSILADAFDNEIHAKGSSSCKQACIQRLQDRFAGSSAEESRGEGRICPYR